MVGDTHSLRQVCHINCGGTWAFLWQPTWLVASHQNKAGCLTKNNSTASCRCAGQEGTGGSASLRAHSRWTARLPTARLPFCGGKKKKARIGSTGCGVSFEWGQIKPVSDWFTRAFPIFMDHKEDCVCGTRRLISSLFWFVFSWRVRDNRQCAAPTWPSSSDCAEVGAHTYLFCAIIN